MWQPLPFTYKVSDCANTDAAVAPADITFCPEMYVISEVDGSALFSGLMMLLGPDAPFTDPRVPPPARLYPATLPRAG